MHGMVNEMDAERGERVYYYDYYDYYGRVIHYTGDLGLNVLLNWEVCVSMCCYSSIYPVEKRLEYFTRDSGSI